MCYLCGAVDADGGYLADGAGLPALNGAGADGAPVGTLPSDRLYAVLNAVNSPAMDRLVPNSNVAPPRQLTYQFEITTPADMPGAYSHYLLAAFAEEQKAVFRAIFADIEALTNLKFTEVSGAADADISLMRGSLESNYGGRGRFTYYYSTVGGEQVVTSYDGFAIFNQTRSLTTPNDIALAYHEVGHALSLRHPGNVDINPANAPPPPYLPAGEDNYKFSVMSYNASPEYAARPDSYMLYDVAALQYRFGANLSTRAGNDSYSTVSGPPDVIWDGGGNDTLDGSAHAFAQYLDLRGGAFSTLGSPMQSDTLAIAFGAVIENAFGGAGNDTLVGNEVDNVLRGGAGTDRLSGGDGNDTLNGGTGSDTLDGGAGTDLADYSGTTAQVAFNLLIALAVVGSDTDTLVSIENARGGSGNDFLLGNDLANILYGGAGDDNLWGFGGNDTLFAEAGNDIAVGGDGSDVIFAGDGQDWLYGQGGADHLINPAGTSGGFKVLVGGDGNDTLEAAAWGFTYVYGGDGATGGGNDTVLVRAGAGLVVLNDFEVGGANDTVRLVGTALSSFAEVQANLSFSGTINGTVLTAGGGTQVWFLNGTQPAQLTAADFQFA